MYKKISDYGIIGNLRSIALVGRDGSIDWLCFPYIDSPSVFGALLDDGRGGRFSLSPTGEWDSVAEYARDTNILVTKFRTRTGEGSLTDFMPVPVGGTEEREAEEHELYRRLKVSKGTMEFEMVFDPRFDYARGETTVERNGRRITVRGGGQVMTLAVSADIPEEDDAGTARWRLAEGESLWFRLRYNVEETFICDTSLGERALAATKEYWKGWLGTRETGRSVHLGHYQGMVDRSALVLKLLYYEKTGTIAAAATTSLPEEIGGVRNWDYRYTWVRDTSFTLQALFNLGHLSETEGYLRWIEKLLSEHGADRMQIMYGLRGEEELPELELDHLDGYKGSRPVRIGNGAATQKQLDIYGEIMDAALRLSDYVGKIDIRMWPVLRGICDHVIGHWEDQDSGIWEVRGGAFSFVYSKVMCWVALDRGITIAKRYGFPGDLKKWEEVRQLIREEVLDRGWSEEKKSFVQHYGSDTLDSSNLLIPIFGFLPFDDPRIVSTIEAAERELSHDGFLYRYIGDDGLPGGEGTFMLCSFWLVDCLIGIGRTKDAEFLLRKLEATSNHLGLFSEEYDVKWQDALGNFPQAFTHIGYINSVIKLLDAKNRGKRPAADKTDREQAHTHRLLSPEIVLNAGESAEEVPSHLLAERLKSSMNILRGAFFDTARSRVAYEKMIGSDAYGEYLELSYSLRKMDLAQLQAREEKVAFWINLYNVIVIHAVIELGVRDSVKEVRNFFKRVRYQIGTMHFAPYEIEHGILRGNRRPPYSLFHTFSKDDERFAYRVESLDPRIHFALVCASSSCPPIDVYTAGNIDEELEISGRTFLNTGGLVLDRKEQAASLSRIFKWYDKDFGENQADILRFASHYLYEEEDRIFIEKHAGDIKVYYQDYDWRLNRSKR
jgi:GH15 family glucan-1,4-alpha-glucosidase